MALWESSGFLPGRGWAHGSLSGNHHWLSPRLMPDPLAAPWGFHGRQCCASATEASSGTGCPGVSRPHRSPGTPALLVSGFALPERPAVGLLEREAFSDGLLHRALRPSSLRPGGCFLSVRNSIPSATPPWASPLCAERRLPGSRAALCSGLFLGTHGPPRGPRVSQDSTPRWAAEVHSTPARVLKFQLWPLQERRGPAGVGVHCPEADESLNCGAKSILTKRSLVQRHLKSPTARGLVAALDALQSPGPGHQEVSEVKEHLVFTFYLIYLFTEVPGTELRGLDH